MIWECENQINRNDMQNKKPANFHNFNHALKSGRGRTITQIYKEKLLKFTKKCHNQTMKSVKWQYEYSYNCIA